MKETERKYKLDRKNGGRIGSFIDVLRLRGPIWVSYYLGLFIVSILLSPVFDFYYLKKYKTEKLSKKEFKFNKKVFSYFYHPYNTTWRHERAIEIPLASYFLRKYKPKDVLEIGNVLSNYFKTSHTVVDNYEIAKRVINKDVMSLKTKNKYKLIVSVSTLEHVGVDGVKEKGKAVRAIEHLRAILAPGGILVFTIPIGYNSDLDKAISEKKVRLDKSYYFKKISLNNKWLQVDKGSAERATYGFPFRWGNAILLGIVRKS